MNKTLIQIPIRKLLIIIIACIFAFLFAHIPDQNVNAACNGGQITGAYYSTVCTPEKCNPNIQFNCKCVETCEGVTLLSEFCSDYTIPWACNDLSFSGMDCGNKGSCSWSGPIPPTNTPTTGPLTPTITPTTGTPTPTPTLGPTTPPECPADYPFVCTNGGRCCRATLENCSCGQTACSAPATCANNAGTQDHSCAAENKTTCSNSGWCGTTSAGQSAADNHCTAWVDAMNPGHTSQCCGALIPTPTPINNPIGFHDDATCQASWGWTCDADDPKQPLEIHMYLDGPAGSGATGWSGISAGVIREQAVADLCGGNPAHGFSWPIPDSLIDGQTHQLYAYAINIGSSGSNQLLSGSPQSITCIPGPWYKLSGASLYKNGAIDNFIPANPLAFDGTDTTERQLIIRGTNPTTQEGVVLPGSYAYLGTGAELSTNQWGRTYYTRSTTYLSNINSFIEYVKLRKKFKVITDLSQMESDTINLLIGNVTISTPGQIKGSVDNAVLLVQGNITLDINNKFNPSKKSLALIATGNIDIRSQVKEIHGILIANTIDIASDGPTTGELKVIGNLITTSDIDATGLKRVRTEWRQPSLFVQFDPNKYIDLLLFLSTIIQEGRTIE